LPSELDADAAASRVCEIHRLGFRIGDRRLLDGVDLRLAGNGITVVMGPNGAGKSLLLRLMHGLLMPTDGEVLWGGAPMDAALRRRQAMVFQRPVLLRRSVAANLRFVLRLRGDAGAGRVAALLAEVGLSGRGGQPARSLSGGEQQRLSLARALALAPEVLFLDEPTANLDPNSTATIERIVRQARARGTKVVFVTHDLGQARRLADDVIFLHAGRVAEHSPAGRFFDHPESNQAADYLAGRLLLDGPGPGPGAEAQNQPPEEHS
jgi:tungstate transport system ATP-binding protein